MKKLLMFSAEWCAPCRAMKALMKSLDEDISVEYIDIEAEENAQLVEQYSIASIPTFVSFIDDTQMQRKTGGTTLQGLRDMFQKS
jgi:thioredoxin 1